MAEVMVWIVLAIVASLSATPHVAIDTIDPNERMAQLLHTSEGSGQVKDHWDRSWHTKQPAHLTPIRVHGGIGPGGP